MNKLKIITTLAMLSVASGCAAIKPPPEPARVITPAEITPITQSGEALLKLPEPAGKILVGVYSFRDMTGQFKPSPSNSFSTVVTQGASAFLVKALIDSGWFIPLERQGLNNVLTERKIRTQQLGGKSTSSLLSAPLIIEGGIVAYDSNTRTGGAGAQYLGIGASTQYREDQVTVNLRLVDIQSGKIMHSASTTKSIFSRKINSQVFSFVRFKELLELEAGYSYNEPVQMCVIDAIESALIQIIAVGLDEKSWALKDAVDIQHAVFQKYLKNHQRTPISQQAAKSTRKKNTDRYTLKMLDAGVYTYDSAVESKRH
ncbi:MAG TPA: curli production assembly/transport protein CsgG [Gammaproteobacteria bacterium]|nr:curli production assembly/transport protein CsgG [Gammaproteobacteria bacterium]